MISLGAYTRRGLTAISAQSHSVLASRFQNRVDNLKCPGRILEKPPLPGEHPSTSILIMKKVFALSHFQFPWLEERRSSAISKFSVGIETRPRSVNSPLAGGPDLRQLKALNCVKCAQVLSRGTQPGLQPKPVLDSKALCQSISS